MPNLSLIATVNTAGFDNLIASKGRLQAVLRKAAFNVEKKAKELAPVDTGNMKGGITPDFSNLPDLEVTITPISALEYWKFVEFGTSRQRAQPFMTPALENERPKFLTAVAEVQRG